MGQRKAVRMFGVWLVEWRWLVLHHFTGSIALILVSGAEMSPKVSVACLLDVESCESCFKWGKI